MRGFCHGECRATGTLELPASPGWQLRLLQWNYLDCDVLQLLWLDHVPVEPGMLGRSAVGNGKQLRIVSDRHGELRAMLAVDFRLVDLYVGLAKRAGCHDHVGAVVIGRFDDL